MLVAEELWLHRQYKERVASADGTESVVIKTAIRDQHRVYRNASAEAVMELDRLGIIDFEQFRPHVNGALTRAAYETGDATHGTLDFGHSAVFADAIEPVERIFDRLLDDAAAATRRLQDVVAAGR
jgi:nitronate monooxygenase